MHNFVVAVNAISIFGVFVIASIVIANRYSVTRMPFALTAYLAATWLGVQYIAQLTPGSFGDLLLIQASVALSPWLALISARFILGYIDIQLRASVWLCGVLLAAFFSILALLGLTIQDAVATPDGIAIRAATYMYYIELLYIAAVLGYALLRLVVTTLRLKGKRRSRNVILILGFSQAVVLSLLGSFFFGDSEITQLFITVGILLFCVIIATGMVRHSLFDIRLAAVRTVAYGLSVLALAAIYYAVAYLVSVTIFKGEVTSTFSMSPLNILLAIALAFIFQPIKNFFDRVTDRIFYRDRYSADDFYTQLNETLTSTTDLRTLLQRSSAQIGDTLKSEQAFFYVQYNHVHHVSTGTEHHNILPVRDAHYLNEYVRQFGGEVIVTDLLSDSHPVKRLLISHKIAVLMPLMRKEHVLGYLALGEQRSSGYTNRDIKILNTVSDELVIAIQNALSVQEVKDINAHLQQRIDVATKELRSSNTRLRHLDATKDEFLSMASHQLRTPLTSVKGYLSMVLEGDAGKVNDMQKHLLSEAFTSSERMVHLIHDFLNVSRLQTGKFMLELHPTDIVKLVEAEVAGLRQIAEARQMKLKFTHKGEIPLLDIDENKIQQVVMNYIDNALYYSRDIERPIEIQLERVGDEVELRVKDSGIGVPKHEQAQLFTKFYRASNARKQRPDGTGVGIYLAKKVITAHGGDILFESKEGKGSTFGFKLPISKLTADTLVDQVDDTANN